MPQTEAKTERKPLECDQQHDPVDRLVRNTTAEEITDWLIKYHGLSEHSRDVVTSNLRQQFLWHRLRGRLDRHPFFALVLELLKWPKKMGE